MNCLTGDFEKDISAMEALLSSDCTVVMHRFEPKNRTGRVACCLFYCDGMALSVNINENIVRPIVSWQPPEGAFDAAVMIERRVINVAESRRCSDMTELADAVLYGDCVILCRGSSAAIVCGTKGFMSRGPEEPEGEKVIRGPREGFTEVLLRNLSFIKRRLRTTDLHIELIRLGSTSNTACAICYLDSAVDRIALDILRKRLEKVDYDGILASSHVAEQIRDHRFSPFHTTGTTERPDVACAKMLEGRICLLVDGSPVAITLPYLLSEVFQSAEEYYVSYIYASISRLLKIMGVLFSVSVVPLYIAIINFHPEMLPTGLLFSISSSREGVPLPSVFEALALLTAFDILREAGARTPSGIGSTLSIVGALVLGQAAVEARFVSAPMVIVIAFSGITGIMVAKMQAPIILTRLGLLALSATTGIYGFMLGIITLFSLLCRMESFGTAYVSGLGFQRNRSWEDNFIRVPYSLMKKRGRSLSGEGR